jgi:hypothetical protein
MTTHEEKVSYVVQQIKQQVATGSPVSFAKQAVSHFVPLPNDPRFQRKKIDLKPLNSLLLIDPAKKICQAESGLTFSDLVQATLQHGLIPYTVPELKTITIGGAVSGCSIEAMSYRYGGFHDSCIEYEIITGQGEVLVCSAEQNPDIFHMVHASYGTIGIISKLTFKLLPAKPYVHMTYKKFQSFGPYWDFMKERINQGDYDFIDSIIHDPACFVVCLGRMVDRAPYVSRYDWLKVFYKSTREQEEDYMDISQYFFRYDADCHWLTKTIPLLESLPARLLLGKLYLGSTNLITWSARLRHLLKLKKRPEVVVDVFIPSKNFENFYNWYVRDFKFFPLWIVPYKAPELYPWISDEHATRMGEPFFIDAAVYGKLNNDPTLDYSEILEKKVFELSGIKTLISRNHYDPETFWKIYSKDRYDAVKSKTDPNNLFGRVYEKMKRD